MPCTERGPLPATLRAGLLSLALIGAAPRAEIGLGYTSVRAARAALEARADVEVVSDADGTRFLERDSATHTQWTFVDRDDPAYPAVVRRDLEQRPDGPTLVTRFVCEGRRAACEALYRRVREAAGLAPATHTR